MVEQKASRRSFLGYAATAIVVGVVAGVGGYYAGILGAAPSEITKTSTVTTTRTAPGGTDTTTVTAPPMTTTITQPPITTTTTLTTTEAPPTIDVDELIDEARKEGELMIYGHTKIYTQEKIIKAFNDKYPFINVGFFRATSGKVAEKFIAEANAGSVSSDIVEVSDPSLAVFMKREGFLERFEVPGYGEQYIQTQGNDPEHYWHTLWGYADCLAYNTNLVTEEEVPKSWKELIDPKWTEKVGMVDPRAGGGWYLLYSYQTEVLGEDWLKALAKLKPRIYSSGGSARDGIIGGEVQMGPSATEGIYNAAVEKGAPVKGVLPAEGTIYTESCTAISKGCPHPNAAKLWVLFNFSAEVADILAGDGTYPFRKGTAISEALIAHLAPKIMSIDELFAKANLWETPYEKLADENYRTSINEQFEQIFLG